MNDVIVFDKDTNKFYTGFGWSPEYPDAMEMTYKEAKKVAKGITGRRLVMIENYGYEDEKEHEI